MKIKITSYLDWALRSQKCFAVEIFTECFAMKSALKIFFNSFLYDLQLDGFNLPSNFCFCYTSLALLRFASPTLTVHYFWHVFLGST
jgi:hypothetical protein